MSQIKIGYARADCSPDKPVRMNSQCTGEYVRDPICITTLSLVQDDLRVLIVSADLRQVSPVLVDEVKPMIAKTFQIPEDKIILSTTHNHSCPDCSTIQVENVRDWLERIGKPAFLRSVEAAIADEKEVTGMVGGKSITERINYVRRYRLADGTWSGIATANPSTAPRVAAESDADPELRAVRLSRKGGKDIVLVNYQTHAASALNQHRDAVCADFVGPMRDKLEAEQDVLALYLQGSCGNTNYTPKLPAHKEEALWEYRKVGEAMAEYTMQALENGTQLNLGKLQLRMGGLTCAVNHTKDHLAPQVQQISEQEQDPDKRLKKLQAIGVSSRYERTAVLNRVSMPEYREMELAALSIGDLGLTFAPVELFDTVGKQLRDASPYALTFNCGYCLTYHGYMPSHQAWPHGEYEVYMCHYLPGTGEHIALAHLEQLQDMKQSQ